MNSDHKKTCNSDYKKKNKISRYHLSFTCHFVFFLIAFISLNSSHLKIDRQTYKAPLRSLHRVRTEIPTLSVTFI